MFGLIENPRCGGCNEPMTETGEIFPNKKFECLGCKERSEKIKKQLENEVKKQLGKDK